MIRKDACYIIRRELSSGPKASNELLEACARESVPKSTFYYHLRQLVEKLHEVEEITQKDSRGRLVKKYSLVKEEKAKPKGELKASEGKG